ncbi:MAG: hypothetical protein JWN66_937 [Sphingomonas bacterium]|uniref:Zn-ribbon domain-containing OB-fold protein n=1 Tax=Sphingomonas bacterium TaxID=1895847 RepID=UPI00263246A0|nr:OB-fold domain-containing protein [Sphingomonas bacterium]MDB5703821.1 hypothetical protein [Sphingomonas bacterium]
MTRIANRPPEALVRIVTDSWTEPFWSAAKEERLTCAQCGNCHRFRMPPTPFCPHCRSQEIDWPTLPGTGTIYSYTVVERAVLPGTEDSIPYVPAVIALDGATPARLISNIVDSSLDSIRIGARVRVIFDVMPDGAAVPRYTVTEESA